jgi:hypothetical protein
VVHVEQLAELLRRQVSVHRAVLVEHRSSPAVRVVFGHEGAVWLAHQERDLGFTRKRNRRANRCRQVLFAMEHG